MGSLTHWLPIHRTVQERSAKRNVCVRQGRDFDLKTFDGLDGLQATTWELLDLYGYFDLLHLRPEQ